MSRVPSADPMTEAAGNAVLKSLAPPDIAALAAGADLALKKPCLPDELEEAVRTFLGAERRGEWKAARARREGS